MKCQCGESMAMSQVAPLIAPHVYWCAVCGRMKNKTRWQVPFVTFQKEKNEKPVASAPPM